MDHRVQLALFGAVPAILVMFYFDWLDRKRPEPPWRLRWVSFVGMLSTVPVIALELLLQRVPIAAPDALEAAYEAFIVAAAPEEFAKLAVIWLVVWRRPEFDERLDGIVYAAHAGLGFALVENVGYLFGAEDVEAYWSTFVARAVLAVPGHAIFAGMMGYLAARKRFDGQGSGLWGGFLLAVAMHGAYDWALIYMPHASNLAAVFLATIPVAVIVGGFLVLRRWARQALHADDHAEAWAAFLAGKG